MDLCVSSYTAARSGALGGGGGAAPGGAGAHPVAPAFHSPRFSPRAGGFAGRPGCCCWCAGSEPAVHSPRFTHLALAGIQPAPAASLQDRAAAADPQPAPAQEQYTFERAYADFAELGARLDRLNADTPEAAARDARIYAETLLLMAGATT